MYAPVFLAVALASIANVGGARILGLFPHTGRSHQMVFEPLLQRLSERGHKVTVVSFFPLKNPSPNYTDISLQGIAPIGVEAVNVDGNHHSLMVTNFLGLDNILTQIENFLPLGAMALNVCRKLVELPILADTLKQNFDVVLVENFNSDCMMGLARAHGLQSPVIGLLSSAPMAWSNSRLGIIDNPAYIPTFSTNFVLSNMSFAERLENVFMKCFFDIWFRYFIQLKEQEIIENSLGRKIDDLQDIVQNTSMLMVNTFHSLHGVRSMVPGLIEVSGMHLSSDLRKINKNLEDFINESEQGVILFSWGSLIKTSTIPPQKEEVIVRALSKIPQRVIWKYENSGPEGNLTGNILRVNWIPQYELLQHKKVLAFIAHGGLLGMTEAISAGKPMVVVPFFGDQPNNGAAAAAAGFGTVLPYTEITEESFLEAVKKVLSPQFRLNARQASMMWNDRPAKALDTAVYWVERVARWGHAAPLHHPARDMPYYQRALLDVIGATLLALVIVLLVLKFLLKLTVKAIMSLFAKEKKKKVN